MLDKKTYLRWVTIAGLVFLASCTHRVRKALVQTSPVPAPAMAMVILDSASISRSTEFAAPSIDRFYANRKFRPAWLEGDRLTAAADSLILLALSSDQYGLLPGDYHADDLLRLTTTTERRTTESITRSEILLTNAFFALAYHLQHGRMDLSRTSRLLRQPFADTLSLKLLEDVLQHKTSVLHALESREPLTPFYQELKYELRKLQAAPVEPGDSAQVLGRIRHLAINMERWRWEESPLPPLHILINIPAFELTVAAGEQEVMRSRVIVGTPEKQTPQLTSEIESFVIYPYWSVPRSIATEELLPVIQADPGYLASHYFDVLDAKGRVLDADTVHWKAYSKDRFPFRLRQREGDDNTLGIIKFVFKNPFGVSLHDTNQKRLFRSQVRTFSHGCIRIEHARELAHYLIQSGNSRLSDEDLELMFIKGERKEVRLARREPILVRYFTCHARKGHVQCYPDCYGLDDALIRVIYGH